MAPPPAGNHRRHGQESEQASVADMSQREMLRCSACVLGQIRAKPVKRDPSVSRVLVVPVRVSRTIEIGIPKDSKIEISIFLLLDNDRSTRKAED